MADRRLVSDFGGSARFIESIRRVAQEESQAQRDAISRELRGLYDKYDELKRIVVDNEIRTTLVEDQFPKNAKVATLAREGHIHEEADIGGGADCMFQYLVSSCAAESGISEGQVFQSLTGCDFKVYSHPALAFADAVTNRATSGQDTVFYICSGDYLIDAQMTIAPPTNGGWVIVGTGMAYSTKLLADASTYSMFSVSNQLQLECWVEFRNIGFDTNGESTVTCIDFAAARRTNIRDCLFYLDNTTNTGIEIGNNSELSSISGCAFQGTAGTGVSSPTDNYWSVTSCTFDELTIGVDIGGGHDVEVVGNQFKCDTGVKVTSGTDQWGHNISGNQFECDTCISIEPGGTGDANAITISGNSLEANNVCIDFATTGAFAAVAGVTISGNSFFNGGSAIGVRGDANLHTSLITANTFWEFTSGNEIVDWSGNGNEAMHNVSAEKTGVTITKQALADIGSPVGHSTTAVAAPNDATYVVATDQDATLPNSRLLTARYNMFLTDGGAAGNLTMDSWLEGAQITPSAGTLTLGTDGDMFHVAAGDFSAIATPTRQTLVLLIFDGVSILTHGANLILQGATNFTSAAGDTMMLAWEGSTVWREINRHTAAAASAALILQEDNADVNTSTLTLDFTEPDGTLLSTSGTEVDVNMALYAMLTGRSGGQTLRGGTAASENLTLQSTSNATRGHIIAPDPFLMQLIGTDPTAGAGVTMWAKSFAGLTIPVCFTGLGATVGIVSMLGGQLGEVFAKGQIGRFFPYEGGSESSGLWAGGVDDRHPNDAAPSTAVDTSHGVYRRFTSGATAGDDAGIQFGTAGSGNHARSLATYMLTKFRLPTITEVRAFIGWSDSTLPTTVSAEEPVANMHGIQASTASAGTAFPTAITLAVDIPAASTAYAVAVTLAEDLDTSETAVDINDGTSVVNGDLILVDSEMMQVSAGGGTVGAVTLTVVRGRNGSTAAIHTNGTAVTICGAVYATAVTLAEDLDTSETAVDINDGTSVENNDIIQVDAELMKVTAGGGTAGAVTLTVVRAQCGSTAAAHSNTRQVRQAGHGLVYATADQIVVGMGIVIDTEWMLVTALNLTNNTVGVTRGYSGTTVATHAAAAAILRRDINWMHFKYDASGGATLTSTSVPITTSPFSVQTMMFPASFSPIAVYDSTFTQQYGALGNTTNLPANTTRLHLVCGIEALTNAARDLDVFYARAVNQL